MDKDTRNTLENYKIEPFTLIHDIPEIYPGVYDVRHIRGADEEYIGVVHHPQQRQRNGDDISEDHREFCHE